MDLNAWISHKAAVRQNSKNINIRIDNLQISAGANTAIAVFTQYYNSSYSTVKVGRKLELRKIKRRMEKYIEKSYKGDV